MKVTIIKNDKNQSIGWTMEGENEEEVGKLGVIRDLQFFGFKSSIPDKIDTIIEYSGRTNSDDKNGNPGILSWKQNHYISH